MFDAVQTVSAVLGAVVLIAVANPPVIATLPPLLFVFLHMRSYYFASSRAVKRWEAVSRSPVFALFAATIKGLPTIRAFRAAPRVRGRFLAALEVNGSWWMAYLSCARCARPPRSQRFRRCLVLEHRQLELTALVPLPKLLAAAASERALCACSWVGFRMDIIAFALLAAAAVLTMAAKDLVSPGLLALAMTQILQLSGSMQVRASAGPAFFL
jgi:ABC-type multidrug transport system fused ATPase/permease subunit